MHTNINKLTEQIKNYKIEGDLEKKGVTRDLESILTRLEKDEYQKGFMKTNVFDIQTRTQSLFKELEFLMVLGHDWSRILDVLPLSNFTKIADICPGYSPKIELGLFFNHFKGEIDVVDVDKDSLDSLTRFAKLFNPGFRIKKKKADIFLKPSGSYDLVLGNHIVDDLIVYHFAKKAQISLTKFYAEEKVAIELWKSILSNKKSNLDEISKKIAGMIIKITSPNGFVCLTQYKSYAEKIFDLNEAYEFNKSVFSEAEKILLKSGFSSHDELLTKAFRNYKGHFGKKDCILVQKNNG